MPLQLDEDAWHKILWGSVYVVGIIGSLWVYGIQQERIMSVPYGDDMFKTSVFLVFCNRFCAIWFAFAMTKIRGEEWQLKAPLVSYLIVSLSNVFASTCQYEALKYVSFPVQMLGKSFKMMPVMLWGMVISSKAYTVKEWAVAFFVTWGVTQFLLTGPIATESGENDDHTSNSVKGLLLLVLFLALDGITSPMQEKLFKEYQLSKYNQLLWVNTFSAIVSMTTLLTSGGLSDALGFIRMHPPLLGDAMTLSVSQVASQWFIYSQIKDFGALVFAATMNVRQLVSIITSYIKYGHFITGLQVLALGFVFAALFYKSYDGLTSETPDKKAEKAPLVPKEGIQNDADEASKDSKLSA
ncbi:slc35b2 [Symbiodinium pilosum]|uniref:Slc35b2 protein n=1 Tax=Symbiodinium pilosum TaxID=2952 RepID=A0A812KCK6_SYMPI|nr:slc35b2 [Symbiodinium pilosum]